MFFQHGDGNPRAIFGKQSEEDGLYRAYVLMEVPIGEANKVLAAQIKANEHLYTRFRAAQGFKELAEEVERYEKFKREQGLR